jgi:hypothetical protein
MSWSSQLPAYEAENIKAWLAIVEKNIARSAIRPDETKEAAEEAALRIVVKKRRASFGCWPVYLPPSAPV